MMFRAVTFPENISAKEKEPRRGSLSYINGATIRMILPSARSVSFSFL